MRGLLTVELDTLSNQLFNLNRKRSMGVSQYDGHDGFVVLGMGCFPVAWKRAYRYTPFSGFAGTPIYISLFLGVGGMRDMG